MQPKLLGQVPNDELIGSVNEYGAYDIKACHASIARRHAISVIPPCKRAKLGKIRHMHDLARNEAVRTCLQMSHCLWRKGSSYHRRSLVETKSHCFKRL